LIKDEKKGLITFLSQEKKGKGYLCRWSFRFLDERNIFETNHLYPGT